MRTIIFLCLAFFCQSVIFAQDFPGYRSGNYQGVNAVFFNPAQIADSRYRWDFNLFATSVTAGNNRASFNFKNLTQSLDSDSLIRQFVGKGSGLSSGMVSVGIHGPSLMFNTSRKSAVALSTRARIMMNAIDIDGALAGQIMDDSESDITYPYTISSNANMQVKVNAWTEFGLSYARVLYEKDNHLVKGGITLKYLAGVANGYAGINGLNGTLTEEGAGPDVFLRNAGGQVRLGFGGVDLDDFNVDQLTSFSSTGFGGDLGFVYEYRPDHGKYDHEADSWRRDLNKYKLRVGLALLDIGTIRYQRDMTRSAGYNVDISGAERLDLNELGDTDIDGLKDYLDSRPAFFTPIAGDNEADYTVSLPTTLHINADYHLHRGFYINLATQLSLVNSAEKIQNSQYYSSFMLVPRYEGKAIGLYLPVSYNKLTAFNAGVSMRLGPLFIGSGSALTALLGQSRQVDVHMGLRFGGLQKNMEKQAKKAEKQKNRKNKKKKDTPL